MRLLRSRGRKSANPGWWICKSAPANRESSKNILDSHAIAYLQTPGIAELWIFCWINCNIVAPSARLLGFGRSGSPKIAHGPSARAIFSEPPRRWTFGPGNFLPTSAPSAFQLRSLCKRSVVLGRFWISQKTSSRRDFLKKCLQLDGSSGYLWSKISGLIFFSLKFKGISNV